MRLKLKLKGYRVRITVSLRLIVNKVAVVGGHLTAIDKVSPKTQSASHAYSLMASIHFL